MKNYFSKERIQTIAVFLVTMLICLIPLFSVNCIQGHDIDYHLLRIESLKEGILMGVPFLKINVLFFGGRGYASSLFYPDLLLYIPALLRCAGVSINLSYHIFVAICFVLAYLTMYYCAELITDNKNTAMIAAVIYSLAQYHLDDVYTRAAVGEFCAYIFIPFLLYGLYEMVFGTMKKPYLLVLGFCGVVLSHTITTILFICVFAVAFIISIKKLWKNKSALFRLFISAIFVVGITAFYWMSVLEQLMCSSFAGAAEFDLNYEKLMLIDLLSNKNPGLGIGLFIPLLLVIFIRNKNDKIQFANLCAIAGVMAGLSATGILPWARLGSSLSFIQFPWRTFMVATPLLTIAGAIYISEYLNENNYNKKDSLGLILVIALFSITAVNTFARLDQGYYSYSNDYYNFTDYTGNVIGGEWLPKSVSSRDKLTKDCDVALSEKGEIAVKRNKNTLSFVSDDSDYVDVPFIYYKGYVARMDGVPLLVDGSGNNGMCRVYLNGIAEKEITVKYEMTAIQIASLGVSVISLVLGLVLCFMRRKID